MIGGGFSVRKPKVGIVGATGAVGVEVLKILEERNFPVGELFLFGPSQFPRYRVLYREPDTSPSPLIREFFATRGPGDASWCRFS